MVANKGRTMSKSDQAKSFLADLLDETELKTVVQENKQPKEPSSEKFIVYFAGDNQPEVVWRYFINPADGMPELDDKGNPTGKNKDYGTRYGYWTSDPEKKNSRNFVQVQTNNYFNMPFQTFMEHPNFIPNKNCVKIYESEADFLLELI